MKQDFLYFLTEVFDREASVVMTDYFRDYGNWDSLRYLVLMTMIEEKYDVEIPREDFLELKTVEDVYDYIQANRSKK